MIKNIIPIRYINSTGGTFISILLSHGRDNRAIAKNFSPHGNAQYMIRDLPQISHLNFNTAKENIKNISNNLPENITYYIPLHNYTLYNDYFSKIINITYKASSILKLIKVFKYKWLIDSNDFPPENIDKECRQQLRFYIERLKFHSKNYLPNVLDLDWEFEILGDPVDLIIKLSNFTLIPQVNFDKNTLVEWQTLTKNLFNHADL